MLSVPLRYQNDVTPSSIVEFRREELSPRQSRHINRYCLKPRLKLDDYRCKAVIDFVELEITTARNTDYKALRRWISATLETSSLWCEQIGGGTNSASKFHARVYDPKVSKLLLLEDVFAARPSGLAAPVKLSRVEVSVDVYARSSSEEDRLSMVGVLQRTYLPPAAVWSTARAQPRFARGRGRSNTSFFLPGSGSQGPNHLLFPKSNFLDSTVYWGEKDSAWQVRVQNKISDQRKGTKARMLDQSDRRARIEVTLAGNKLAALKLQTLNDLERVSFATVQREFFHFALPTFDDSTLLPHLQCVVSELNSREQEQFKRGGVACLERQRDLKEEWLRTVPNKKTGVRTSYLRGLRDNLRVKGFILTDRRAGRGLHGTTIAYSELNNMVRSALRDLERRIRGGEKRS